MAEEAPSCFEEAAFARMPLDCKSSAKAKREPSVPGSRVQHIFARTMGVAQELVISLMSV